jgi:8-oxo-dGTP diphosphatase
MRSRVSSSTVRGDVRRAVTGPLVGVSAIVVRDGLVVVGRRKGSHGAGSWAFPGGKVEPGEDPRDVVRRELAEETGLEALRVEPIAWTSDVVAHGPDTLHFITLHHLVEAAPGEPVVCETDKVESWRWVACDEIPEPIFAPTASLLATGWRPEA